MKLLSVDRMEGNYVICEDDEKKLFAIDVSELPKHVKEGDVIRIKDSGDISVDEEETARRRKNVKERIFPFPAFLMFWQALEIVRGQKGKSRPKAFEKGDFWPVLHFPRYVYGNSLFSDVLGSGLLRPTTRGLFQLLSC